MNDHIILCGLGKVGMNVLEHLRVLDEPVLAIAREVPTEWRRRAQQLATRYVEADARDEGVLAEADIHRARAIVIVTDNDLANLEIAVDARRASPGIAIVVRMSDLELAEGVRRELHPHAVLNPAALAAPAFAAAALGESVLRSFTVGDATVNIVSIKVTGPDDGAGQSLAQVADRYDVTPLAVRAGYDSYAIAPSQESVLAPGDELLVAASQASLGALPGPHGAGARPVKAWRRPRWLGRIEEFRHTLSGIWRTATPPTRFAFLALNVIGIASTVVFRQAMGLSWVDAVYFTVTILTTVGFGDLSLAGTPVWLKLFGCVVMLSGVAITLTFFGVFAEHLASRRFAQAMGARRITLREHVVVAGLGRLGYMVTRRLRDLGCQVSVIEHDHDARHLGLLPPDVPFVLGDAGQPQRMKLAGVQHARALIAVTDDDLANLRITQLARTMNPGIRTVVRLFHSNLASKLMPFGFGIDAPVNPSQVAAATFAASALAPSVLHAFALGGRMMLLRWLDAPRAEQCVGRTVGELRARGVMVVLHQPAGARAPQAAGKDTRVGAGDQLVVCEQYRTYEHADDGVRPGRVTGAVDTSGGASA